VIAWAAIAMASRAKVSSVQIRKATWCAAMAALPCRAAMAVVMISAACSASVRATSDAPAKAAARTPARSGAKLTPARFAPRPTTVR
jgi:hypothetical protein